MGTKRRRDQIDDPSPHKPSGSTDGAPARKKQLAYTEDDAKLAQLYNGLAEDVKATRLQAARDILKIVEEADQDRVEKICQRLIRGLCSNRKAARLGYVIVLTEVFFKDCPRHSSADDFKQWLRKTVANIETCTVPPANGSNQERKDYQLGRCLAFRSLIQSKIFTSSDATQGLHGFKFLLGSIFTLYKEAAALRPECGATANSILSAQANPSPDFAVALLQAYQHHGLAKSPEGLAAWLDAQLAFNEIDFPTDVWRNNDPLDPKERSALIPILRDNNSETSGENGNVNKAGNGNAQRVPCSAWNAVLKSLWARSTEDNSSTFFGQFWTEVVNDGFFSTKASIERKAIGLQIVQSAIATAPHIVLNQIFSPNVLRSIINQRASTGNNLYVASQAPLSTLVGRTKADQQAVKPVVQALIGTAGLSNFDRLTRTKTLEDILSNAPVSDAAEILAIISGNVRQPKTSDHLDADASRRSTADLLLTFARRQGAVQTQAEADCNNAQKFPWLSILEVTSEFAYLKRKTDGDDAIPKKIREIFQARTTSILTFTMESKLDPEFDHAWQVIDFIDRAIQSGKCRLALEADDAIHRVLSTSLGRTREVRTQESKASLDSKPLLRAFKLLFALSVLQVYNGEPDAVSILEELEECYKMWSKNQNSSSTIIEILLGFVSKPSALFRKLAENVFAAIADQVGEDGILSLLDILDKPENLSGQRELFENAEELEADAANGLEDGSESDEESSSEGEDEDKDDDAADDDDDASDVEVVDMDGVDDSVSSSDSGDGSSNESGGDSDDESAVGADDELTAFEAKLAQTLGTSKHAGNGDDGSDTSDESDMDDEQMMALDGHLTTIFKERTKQSNKKKESKDAKGTVVNFKNRVLDLLTIYVRECYQSPLVLDLIQPLLKLSRTTQTKAISERAFTILKLLFDTCTKHKAWPDQPSNELFDSLDDVQAELRLSTSKIHASAASRSSLYLVKLLVSKDKAHYARIADMYATLQKEWFSTPTSKIPASIFTEWTSWTLNSRK
ncbi:hypothetical protein K461DRAFT_290175 [Myriangium duriaei CBS 260.36]|uniref:DNA polymerase V n=1 Tax=Myriangium duriaei CBS 260.36 TaxID=1168546 RepID=A0A9P4JF80_9PEZI|nr:hypothetical protein K461DRAFT_290175 [Myriangium duriaei CBS 260.36]